MVAILMMLDTMFANHSLIDSSGVKSTPIGSISFDTYTGYIRETGEKKCMLVITAEPGVSRHSNFKVTFDDNAYKPVIYSGIDQDGKPLEQDFFYTISLLPGKHGSSQLAEISVPVTYGLKLTGFRRADDFITWRLTCDPVSCTCDLQSGA